VKHLSSVVYALVLFGLLIPATAFAKASLGFSISASTDGYFSSTLVEVKVASVKAGSPSEKAGLMVGDLILDINGKPVKGANGLAMKKILGGVKSGEHLLLKVQRGREGVLVIDIVAGP